MPAFGLNPLDDAISAATGGFSSGLGPSLVQPTQPLAAPGVIRAPTQTPIATTVAPAPAAPAAPSLPQTPTQAAAPTSPDYVDVPADEVEQWQKDWKAKNKSTGVVGDTVRL